MRILIIGLLTLSLIVPFAAAQEENKPTTEKEKASYAIGLDIGNNLSRQGVEIVMDSLILGINHALQGTDPLFSNEEIQEIVAGLQQRIQVGRQEAAAKNKAEAEKFLAENKTKEGVETLDGGLQYIVLTEGEGKSPKASDTVQVHYKGMLMDGTEFDSSYDRGEPTSFPVNKVISGWSTALQEMKVGSKWKLFVPPDMAYGEAGMGPIQPNSLLIFEMELLEIE